MTTAEKIAKFGQHIETARYLVNNVSPFAEVHVGTGNSKTGCTNEASMPGLCCHASAATSCGISGCYAMGLQAIYPAYYWALVRNTALRRRDAGAYYETFFEAAEAAGLPLRVNESGDFEHMDQLRAMFAAARRHPSVVVIGYTKRPELLEAIGAETPNNVYLRYSVWTGDAAGEALARFPLVFRPSSTRGLVRVTASGLYCRADLVVRYRMAARELAAVVATWTTSRPADVFEAALIEAQGDEAAALASIGLNYHDDRGDGLLHVPAFNARKYRAAWTLACCKLAIDSRATGARR